MQQQDKLWKRTGKIKLDKGFKREGELSWKKTLKELWVQDTGVAH